MKILRGAAEVTIFVLFVYLIISVVSLGQVAMGESVPYMPFWHGPWRWAFKFLNP